MKCRVYLIFVAYVGIVIYTVWSMLYIQERFLDQKSDAEQPRVSDSLRLMNLFRADNDERQQTLYDICQRKIAMNDTFEIGPGVVFNDKLRIIYCATPKIASTTWKNLLLTLMGDVMSSSPHTSKNFKVLRKCTKSGIQFRRNNYPKIMFSREPLERVLSAYRDKFENKKNKHYNMAYGRFIIKKYRKSPNNRSLLTGQGTTFTEFSNYLIDPANMQSFDSHWAEINRLCTPCAIQYDYIGKYESMTRDSNMILQQVAPYSHLSFPNRTNSHPSSGNSSLLLHYYRQLPPGTVHKLWEIYEKDYAMFGYPYPSDLEREVEALYYHDLSNKFT